MMYYITCVLSFFALTAAASLSSGEHGTIHGRAVSTECLKAYTALFQTENDRHQAFLKLAATTTGSQDLDTRLHKAASAMTEYQAVLTAIDTDLAGALSRENKAKLERAAEAQQDIAPLLSAIEELLKTPNKQTASSLQAALDEFKKYREVEVKAATQVELACPDDAE